MHLRKVLNGIFAIIFSFLLALVFLYKTYSISQFDGIDDKKIRVDSETLKSKWIVVTSVNNPTIQIEKLSKIADFQLLVVGDLKTSKNWSFANTVYLGIDEQEKLNFKIFKNTPFNSYTRKNIGYLYAIQHGAKYIYDTDDDNAPMESGLASYFHFENSVYGLTLDVNVHKYVNPYAHFGQPTIWPRGFGLAQLHLNFQNDYLCGKRSTSIVQQGLVNGDPDVDAIFRLTKTMNFNKLNVTFDSIAPPVQIPMHKYAPYNSQNTFFHYQAFWSLYLPQTVTFRLTDIWRSYWSQRLMWLIGGTVSFHGPTAIQVRNPHSYLKDFEEEQEMYVKTEQLIQVLSNWTCKKTSFYSCVIDLSELMEKKGFWEKEDVEQIHNWISDLQSIGYQEPELIYKDEQSTFLVAPFKVRYSPVFQKLLDLDNYCCPQAQSIQERYDGMKFLQNFCYKTPLLMNYTRPFSYLNKWSSLNGNYVLLITFNFIPLELNINLLKYIYGNYFKMVVFCGKDILSVNNSTKSESKKFDSYTFIEFDTHSGYNHYYCMNKLIEMNLNVDGVLLMSDDVLLKYWRLHKDLNFEKIWFNRNLSCWENIRLDKIETKWEWWNSKVGVEALVYLWEYIDSCLNGSTKLDSQSMEILQNYVKTLRNNYNSSGEYEKACHSQADLFYLPKSKFKQFHFISSIFYRFSVFLEISVGTILSGLASHNEIDLIQGNYQYECGSCFGFDLPSNELATAYKNIIHFYHPVKIPSVYRDFRNVNFCTYFIKEKIENDLKIEQ